MNKLIGFVALALFATASLVVNAQPPSGGFSGQTGGYVSGPNPYFVPGTAVNYHSENGGYQNTRWEGYTYKAETHYHTVRNCGPCGPTYHTYPHTTYQPKWTTNTTNSSWRSYSGFNNGYYSHKEYSGWNNNFHQETETQR